MLPWAIATVEAYTDCADGKAVLVMAVTPPATAAGAPAFRVTP